MRERCPTNWLPAAIAALCLAATAAAPQAQGGDELIAAARAGEIETVRALLAAGIDADARDEYGATPLMVAASRGHREIAELLLEAGADPDAEDDFYGFRAIGWALFNGHDEIAELLLAAGADAREDVLRMAVPQAKTELVRAAVEAGPIYASTLAELQSSTDDPALAKLLARAESRPDPPLPSYSPDELRAFTGVFEGWTSDDRAEVALADGALELRLNDGAAERLEVAGDKRFGAASGAIAVFYGRAGQIEGLQLTPSGGEALRLQRSIGEALGPGALRRPDAAPRASETAGAATVHWPAFRGANASGIGDGAELPEEWDLASGRNVRWSSPLPGLGNSSPVVWGNKVFVTTAVAEGVEQGLRTGLTGAIGTIDEPVEHRWLVLAFDKASGEELWRTEIGRGVPLTQRHFKATQANSTPATDGRHLVVVFPTAGFAALDLDGTIRWKHELGGLNAGAFNDPGIEWGYASSPIVHDGKAILQVDVHGGQYLGAWSLATGEPVWRVERDVAPSWSTPAVIETPRGDELVVNGSTIHGYDAETGRELWSLGPNSELVIAAPVVGDDVVYVSAGYPPVKPIYAIPAGFAGEHTVDPRTDVPVLAWNHGVGGAYMPTPLLYRGLLYVVHHNGRLVTYDAASGAIVDKRRFSRGGTFTASPVAANGKLYAATEEGLLYVLETGPEPRELAVHEIGEPLMATPAVSEGMLLLRTPTRLLALARETAAERAAR